MNLKVFQVKEFDLKELEKIDKFIMDEKTNGEFINSIRYLSYHGSRFNEDSIMVKDMDSGTIKGVLFAVVKDDGSLVSHAGTTFAGPVIRMSDSFSEMNETIEMMLNYYEGKYERIYLKITPPCYMHQEMDILKYILMRHGYQFEMTALANIINIGKIKEETDLMMLYDGKKRNHLKKVLKSSKFVFSKEDRIDEEIWRMMNDNLKSKFDSRTTHTYDEINRLHDQLCENIKPYAVRTVDGDYAAFALIYKFKNVFHTQYLDVNYKYTGQYPNLYLIHCLIKIALDEGYGMFSFGASTEDDGMVINEGLYSYKKGYGGGTIILPVLSKEIN